MNYKPILFNTEMVQAILDGRKTQTRRIIRKVIAYFSNGKPSNTPPVAPGDVLWVKETWNTTDDCGLYPPWPSTGKHYMFLADDPDCEAAHEAKWRPSIHMPKEAARIFLRVDEVRAERLQFITDEDAMDEGANPEPPFIDSPYIRGFISVWEDTLPNDKILKYGWDANPWVWVIKFSRIEKPEGWPNA